MKRTGIITTIAIAIAVAAYGYRTALGKPEQATATATAAAIDRKPDEAAIRKVIEAFTAAFEKGDAAAAAAFLTSGAEIKRDDAPTVRGRDKIQTTFAAHFSKNPKGKIALVAGSVRFISRDTAVEEGQMTVTAADGGVTTNSYSVLYVREEGKWLLALIQEWDTNVPVLHELDWLIGTWSSKQKDSEVQTTYEWFGNKSFIRSHFTIREKNKSYTGMQLIGTNPSTGELKTWTFEHDGGIGEGTCMMDGHRWVFENSVTLANGSALEVTNILVPIDRDSFTWLPLNLTVDGEQFGNLPPVKVTRVKSK